MSACLPLTGLSELLIAPSFFDAANDFEPARLGASTASPVVRVLMIEGDEIAAMRLRRSIASLGVSSLQLTHVTSFNAAIEELNTQRFDVVLVDLSSMPRGLRAFLRMQMEFRGLPVIVMTQAEDSFLGARAMMAGATGHVVRDETDPEELLRALRSAASY